MHKILKKHFISIVIPHYNNNDRLKKTLESISGQINTIPSVEVIIVDNASDNPPEIMVQGFGFQYLSETKYLNSPYSARNRGIEAADGDIIILLDASCVPQPNWLRNGIMHLSSSDADIVSANIVYEYSSPKPSIAEIWDANFGTNVKSAIQKHNYAPGGCLFVRREVFNQLGKFKEGIRSGGDYTFTNQAVSKGMSLQICEDAIVKYPAKNFADLKNKSIRVGKGHIEIWLKSGRFWQYFIKSMFKPFYLPNPIIIKRNLTNLCLPAKCPKFIFIRIYLFSWYLKVLQFKGNILGVFNLLAKKS
jgi:glycosyltransferase AglE